jgi:hypothetical protein
MNRRTLILTIALLSLCVMLAVGASRGTATTRHRSGLPRWEAALVARSRALDQRYGLGAFKTGAPCAMRGRVVKVGWVLVSVSSRRAACEPR